ncbi:MAG TPA: DUF1549 and DUF1553 domain-containing protein, partial [Verrucomicrobiae bacterium]|nr:DUF1549 and DUF1553 domain-containing protein [Verrucomicrobiae bacterium]
EEERNHWSFQPIRRPTVPKTRARDGARTPIDAFLLANLRAKKLAFSPEAERATLIRRLTLDLTGLPPSPDEVAVFVADKAPDSYERLVDRLLDSPHYGERWARHWLDVAGYADSDGYTDADTPRPYAYKYRDYVIKSLNADKPFDQFITEQLAGDELVKVTKDNAQSLVERPGDLEKLIATGYLRMAADGTATGGIDQDVARNQVVADTIKIVSTSLLGLSVGCAQCHDHRYDPIPQADYYRLRAVFEPALDWKNWRNPSQRLVSLYTEADRKKSAEVDAEANKLAAEREAKQKTYISEALDKHLQDKFDAELRPKLRAAYDTPADKRTPEQKKLLEDNPSINIDAGTLYQYNPKAADELKAMDAKINEVRGRKPPEDFVQVLTEAPDKVPVTYLFHRGDPKQPQGAYGPGALKILSQDGQGIAFPEKDKALPSTGRREAFARWLTSTNDPLFARVIVNRVWMQHFGRGLVGTPADFGMSGEKPSHPELLDWLASVFSAPSASQNTPGAMNLNWSLKRLHKLIVTSAVYRQSSARDARKEKADPENRLYWRQNVRRLDAEAIRDSILAVTGVLSPKMYGPPVPVREDIFGQIVVGIDKKEGDTKNPVDVPMGEEEFRRSIYIQARRSQPLAVLTAFDAPVMDVNCERRQSSTVAPQALMLMNSDFILKLSARFAERVHRDAGDDLRAQIWRAWQLAYGRAVSVPEMARAVAFLERQIPAIRAANEKKADAKGDKKGQAAALAPETRALTDLCQALLGANEFLYID